MRRNNSLFKKRYMVVGLFLLLIGGISLGFAELRETLTVTSDVLITKERFDVHFERQSITEGSVSLSEGDHAVAIDPSDNDKLSFKITLNQPGDFYEFTMDMANSGNVDAKVTSITLGQDQNTNFLTQASQNSLPTVNEVITAGNRKTLLFRVEYNSSIVDESEIVEGVYPKQTYELTYKISYAKND